MGVFTVIYGFLLKDYILPFIIHKDSSPEFIDMAISLFRFEVFSKLTSAAISISLADVLRL